MWGHNVLYKLIILTMMAGCYICSAAQTDDTTGIAEVTDPIKAQKKKLNKALTVADTETFKAMCDTLYQLGIEYDDDRAVLDSYFFGITHLADQGLVDEALSKLDELKDLTEKLGNTDILYETWANLIVVHYQRNNNSIGAISEITKMQNYALEHKDVYGLGLSYCTMGNCYDYAPELAIQNYEKSIEYFKGLEDASLLTYPLCLICQTEGELKHWDAVIDYAKQIKQSEKYSPSSYAYFADIMLLRAYTYLEMKEEASTVFDFLQRPLRNNYFSPNSKAIFGYVATEYLCKYGDPEEALKYIDFIGNDEDLLTAKILYYTAIKDYKQSVELYNELDEIRAESLAEYTTSQFENANAHFNNQALELENEHITNRYQRVILIIALMLLVVMACVVIYLISLLRKLSATKKQLIQRNAEVVKLEAETRAREEMKTSFIQFMSHEIRTPLNVISGFSGLLLDPNCTEGDRRKFTDIMRTNVANLTRILDKMIEMSDLITVRDHLETEQVDIVALLTQLIKNLESVNINHLKISLISPPSYTIDTNDTYFLILFKNLLENAIKFTESGSVSVSVDTASSETEVIISVSDTGPGIPPDKYMWVFDRFTKIDDFKPGIGVGLYICRLIIERLGGSVNIDPGYTMGTRFIVKHPKKVNQK